MTLDDRAALVGIALVVCVIAAGWALSHVYERIWDFADGLDRTPDYHRIAFLEDVCEMHHLYPPPAGHRCPKPVNPSSGAAGLWQVPPPR